MSVISCSDRCFLLEAGTLLALYSLCLVTPPTQHPVSGALSLARMRGSTDHPDLFKSAIVC